MLRGLEHFSYEEGLRKLVIPSPEQRRLQGNLTGASQICKRELIRKMERLFTRVCSDRIRGNCFELERGSIEVKCNEEILCL